MIILLSQNPRISHVFPYQFQEFTQWNAAQSFSSELNFPEDFHNADPAGRFRILP